MSPPLLWALTCLRNTEWKCTVTLCAAIILDGGSHANRSLRFWHSRLVVLESQCRHHFQFDCVCNSFVTVLAFLARQSISVQYFDSSACEDFKLAPTTTASWAAVYLKNRILKIINHSVQCSWGLFAFVVHGRMHSLKCGGGAGAAYLTCMQSHHMSCIHPSIYHCVCFIPFVYRSHDISWEVAE